MDWVYALFVGFTLGLFVGCVLGYWVGTYRGNGGSDKRRSRGMKKKLKRQVMGFVIGLLVTVGFTVLGLMIDIKIITMYDYNPWSISFTLIFICVGLITGWIVGTLTTRRLVEDVGKGPAEGVG